MNARAEMVLITGASSGIGLELARGFAAEKSNLILVARNREALETLAAELQRAHGIQARVLVADLAKAESPRKIYEELSVAGVVVDVLVNNAGFGLHGEFAELSRERQVEMIQVNVSALTELTRWFLPGMRERRRGGILNVGSVAGFLPGPYMAVYYATKAYVMSLTEALAEELAESGLKISVLCPGPTESNFGHVARGGKPRPVERAKMSAREVAVAGIRGFRAGKVIVVPGMANKVLSQLPRVIPRKLARATVKGYNRVRKPN